MPTLNRQVAGYCFGDLTEEEMRSFEAHLLDCDFCWHEVERLEAAIGLLRTDRDMTERFSPADAVALFGISSRVTWPFAGHLWHVLASCTLYALLYSVALLVEVAYQFDQFGSAALKIAPLVFLWILATSMAGLAVDWRRTQQRRTKGLTLSVSTFVAAALLLHAALWLFLPGYPLVQASIQTYTAQAAYLKSVIYFLPVAVVFLLLPFHFVVVMQRELQLGRHNPALALLTGERHSITPPKAVYLRLSWLLVALAVIVLVAIPMGARLFDNLRPGAYMNLFTQLVLLRTLLYFGLAVACVAWYSHSLNELKRECLAVVMNTSVGRKSQ
jgi:hypothetical protein